MLHKESATPQLLHVAHTLFSIPELNSFRLVGGTAIALQLGHRKSVDIDLFSNEKTNKAKIRSAIHAKFPNTEVSLTQDNLQAEINGVRVEIYDDWHIPFKGEVVVEEDIRLASLEDLTAFKLSAITGRREKKDYIDLFFLFKRLGAMKALEEFMKYDPLLSMKSILFALSEVNAAKENKSPMPNMLANVTWGEISESMIQAAKNYVAASRQN